MHYEALIDPTNFGVIEAYLQDRRCPIYYVLHVQSEALLPVLAEKLDREMQNGRANPEDIARLVKELLPERSLWISSRRPLLVDPNCLIDASSIPKSADCKVIYLPPFYLAHTPGLFEGTFHQQAVPNQSQMASPKVGPLRIKL